MRVTRIFLVLLFGGLLFVTNNCSNSTELPPVELPLSIAYSPDLSGTNIDSLFVCDDKGERKQFLTTVKELHSIVWPPEGEKIYVQENHVSPLATYIYAVAELGGEKEEIFSTSGLSRLAAISRDGKVIILRMRETGSEILELFRLNTDQGSTKKLSNGQTEDDLPAIAPNVTMLAYEGSVPEQSFGNIFLYNLYSGSRVQVTGFDSTFIDAITFSPNNGYIYFSCRQQTGSTFTAYLMRYAINSKGIDTLYSYTSAFSNDYISDLTWSDGKTQLAFTARSEGNNKRHIYIMDLNGNNRRQISTVSAEYTLKGFNGIYVYFSYDSEDENGIYKIDTGSSEITSLIECYACKNIIWDFKALYR